MPDEPPKLTIVPPSEPSEGGTDRKEPDDKVVRLQTITSLDLNPNVILQEAMHANLGGVIVIGYSNDKSEYFASSIAAADSAVWLLQRSIHKLMRLADEGWDETPPTSSA